MNSIILSLKFLSVQNKFSYRLMFEIGLIITLLVSISGMINGVSGQFITLVTQSNAQNASYLMMQKNATLENSKIPVEVINELDTTYFSYYTPILYETALDSNNQTLPFIYANYSKLINVKPEFMIKEGNIPNSGNQILLGEGLQQQLFTNITLPYTIQLQIGKQTVEKTVTGIFSDNGFYNYGLLDNIETIWTNITTVSMFQFEIKNVQVFPAFQTSVNEIVHKVQPDLKLDITPLKKTAALSKSFYNDIYSLFYYLQIIMLLLLALKVTHASYTLYNRYYKDFMVLRIIGESNIKLQLVFYTIIAIIGNIGLVYGLVIGIALPHVFLLITRVFVQYQGLYLIIPSISDIVGLFVLVNVFFIANSFWVAKLHLDIKMVT